MLSLPTFFPDPPLRRSTVHVAPIPFHGDRWVDTLTKTRHDHTTRQPTSITLKKGKTKKKANAEKQKEKTTRKTKEKGRRPHLARAEPHPRFAAIATTEAAREGGGGGGGGGGRRCPMGDEKSPLSQMGSRDRDRELLIPVSGGGSAPGDGDGDGDRAASSSASAALSSSSREVPIPAQFSPPST